MTQKVKTWLRSLATVASLGVLLVPLAARASDDVPSYATKTGPSIHGTVTGFGGKYTMYVRDDRGYIDNVTLHQGTVINPTGIQLQPGFRVTIYGEANDNTFAANEIDTPYRFVPVAVTPYAWGPGPGWWRPRSAFWFGW
jgi:hypothetical protein